MLFIQEPVAFIIINIIICRCFVVDTFLKAENAPAIMRIETEVSATELEMPPFINILREVTDEDEYSSSKMARSDWKFPAKDREQYYINAFD
jgi:hypothetical protein